MISVVVVYNNEGILNKYLVSSLGQQTAKFELVKVDNTQGPFKSASEALNYGAKGTEGKYIMFVHQDVSLRSTSWLKNAEKTADSLSHVGAIGVAGKTEGDGRFITSVMHGNPPKLSEQNCVKSPTKVQTLDECLIIVPKSVFDKLKFDEEVCDGWHLYGVDYSLSIKNLGLDAYVIPLPAYHASTGIGKNILKIMFSLEPHPKEYYRILPKILSKHSAVGKIYTTCGNWSLDSPLFLQKLANLMKGGIRQFAFALHRSRHGELCYHKKGTAE